MKKYNRVLFILMFILIRFEFVIWYTSGIRHQAPGIPSNQGSSFTILQFVFFLLRLVPFVLHSHFVNEIIEFPIANLFFFFFGFFLLARAAGCWLLVAAFIFILTNFSPSLIIVRHWALPNSDFRFSFSFHPVTSAWVWMRVYLRTYDSMIRSVSMVSVCLNAIYIVSLWFCQWNDDWVLFSSVCDSFNRNCVVQQQPRSKNK